MCSHLSLIAVCAFCSNLHHCICKFFIEAGPTPDFVQPSGHLTSHDRNQLDQIAHEYVDWAFFWERHYSVVPTNLPSFLESHVNKILNTGKYLNVVQQCGMFSGHDEFSLTLDIITWVLRALYLVFCSILPLQCNTIFVTSNLVRPSFFTNNLKIDLQYHLKSKGFSNFVGVCSMGTLCFVSFIETSISMQSVDVSSLSVLFFHLLRISFRVSGSSITLGVLFLCVFHTCHRQYYFRECLHCIARATSTSSPECHQ